MKDKGLFMRIGLVEMKWAAVVCILLIAGSTLLGCQNIEISGRPAMMHYEGPLLPLNAIGDTEGITVARETRLDFSGYEAEQKKLEVTDSYALTNSTKKEKNIEIFYPFVSSVQDSARLIPALMLNGEVLQGSLLMGDYTGGFRGADAANRTTHNLDPISTWEGYKALLEDGSYFKGAQKQKNFVDQPVTVYTFYDVTYPQKYDAATLAMEFDLPQGSQVITYGINGARLEDKSTRQQYSYFVSHNMGQKIIILGEPPAAYSLQGYENGACEKEVEDISGKVRVENMQLSEAIRTCMLETAKQPDMPAAASPLVTDELAFRAVISMFQYTALGETPKDRYGWMRLDDLIRESYSMERVMYLTAQISIPPGQTVVLDSQAAKGASYAFPYNDSQVDETLAGYDLMTTLGSKLEFSAQKARIMLPADYELADQNFGFDIAKGTHEINLDKAQEHYYLQIKVRK